MKPRGVGIGPLCLLVGVALSVLSCGNPAWAALLADNANALDGWHDTLIAEHSSGEDVLSMKVDYAVFAPGQYPGQVPDKDSQYVYAYQAFNQAVSTVALTAFSVGLDPLADADNIGDDASAGQPGVGGGVSPDLAIVGTSSARWGWGWIGGFEVGADEHSTVVLFTSPNAPTWDTATMLNGGFPTPVGLLPSPVPEPATASLLALGLAAMLGRWRRSRV